MIEIERNPDEPALRTPERPGPDPQRQAYALSGAHLS